MKETKDTYLYRIDHLRFFAAFLVIVWHYSHHKGQIPTSFVPKNILLNIFDEGHTGVSLFLVISGFVFEYISFGKEIIYSKFIYNRVLRIFPLFVIFTLYAVYTNPAYNPTNIIIDMFTFIDPKGLPNVGWTVGIEFQFYLIFPFLHSILSKKGPLHIFFILIFFFTLRTITYYNFGSVQELSYWSIFGRIDQFLIGMLVAYLYRKGFSDKFDSFKLGIRYLLSMIFIITGLLSISYLYRYFNGLGGFYSIVYPSKEFIWVYLPTAEAVCYASLILGFLFFPKNYLRYFDWFFSKLGELSYSIYWMHFIIIIFLFDSGIKAANFNQALFNVTFIVAPIVIALSLITYNFIEKPFLEKRVKYHI